MKIALMFAGLTRGFAFKDCPFFQDFLNSYDVDIYCTTWDDIGLFSFEDKFELKPFKEQILLQEDYHNQFKKFSFSDHSTQIMRDLPRFDPNRQEFWANSLQAQYYGVQKSYELIDNPFSYDVIVRARYDSVLTSSLPIFKNHYLNFSHRPSQIIDDWLAYGNPDIMSKYCNLYSHFWRMQNDYNIDFSWCEGILYHYLTVDQNIHLNNIGPQIIKILKK
jgi:hypothetical protein